MKYKNVFSCFAIVAAVAMALAFKSADRTQDPISALYKNGIQQCVLTGTTNEEDCDPARTNGTQCTIDVAGDPLAFKNGACDPLYRP